LAAESHERLDPTTYLDIIPLLSGIPGSIGIAVMQKGGDNQPRSKHGQWSYVVVQHRLGTVGLGGVDYNREHREPCSVRDTDIGLSALEDRVAFNGPEVAAAIDVNEPSRTHEHHDKATDLVVEVVRSMRIEHFVVVDVSSVLVVVVVRKLPRFIRNLGTTQQPTQSKVGAIRNQSNRQRGRRESKRARESKREQERARERERLETLVCDCVLLNQN
jgi:Sec-independent protein translocase protein TatA